MYKFKAVYKTENGKEYVYNIDYTCHNNEKKEYEAFMKATEIACNTNHKNQKLISISLIEE